MLVFVTSLWVTEAIPYFVTALLIPVLVVMMDIMETSKEGEHRFPEPHQDTQTGALLFGSFFYRLVCPVLMAVCARAVALAPFPCKWDALHVWYPQKYSSTGNTRG